MSQTKKLQLYLRKTSGSGQKVNLNQGLTLQQLYSFVRDLFHFPPNAFELYFKGQKLSFFQNTTINQIKMCSGSIVHVQQKINNDEQKLQVKIYCQGEVYTRSVLKNSTISALKQELSKSMNCGIHQLTISYLGKILQDNQVFMNHSIKNNDLLSLTITPFAWNGQSEFKLKPKIVESATLTPSEQQQNIQQFTKQQMRKSSMKSSQQSRQILVEEQKKLLQISRPKSESEVGNAEQNMKKSGQIFNIFNHPWLSNRKVIQTESINLDEPNPDDENERWMECTIQLVNQDQSRTYSMECTEAHNLQSVIKVLAKCERIQMQKIIIVFGDENAQKMAQQGSNILQIAKTNKTKILHHVIFK